MREISWLHFTDLHCTQQGHDHYWPTYKSLLKADLKKTLDKVKRGWDLVFFSGDLVFSGNNSEFKQLTEVLEEIWFWFKEDGVNPLLVLVPGNHDLVRLKKTNPIAISLSTWENNPDLRKLFWDDPGCDYRLALNEAYANYTSWLKSTPVPIAETFSGGIIPGDFSLSHSVDGFQIGIVGLNSAFMQLTDGDYKGKINISSRQIIPLMENSPDDWCRKHHFNVLVTHHGPSWYSPISLDEYKAEINPPQRFNLHLFGHLHEAKATNIAEGGSEPRYLRQGHSLFGLEHYGEMTQRRKHGYFACKIKEEGASCTERYWPRVLVTKAGGHYGLEPDTSFDRDQDDSVKTIFSSREIVVAPSLIDAQESNQSESAGIASVEEAIPFSEKAEGSLEEELSLVEANKSKDLYRFKYKISPHHQAIRQAEQASIEKALLETRCAILACDWGLGKEGFLGSVFARLERGEELEVFRLSCNESETYEQIDKIARQQFGFSFQETSHLLSSLNRPLLILDDLSLKLFEPQSQNISALERIVYPLLDFCPTLLVILCIRQLPQSPRFPAVTLCALEIPDTKQYIHYHNLSGEDLRGPNIVEALHLKSDGLPMHLDRLIQELQVSSLYDVLAADDGFSQVEKTIEPVPLALRRAVGCLLSSVDRHKRRSYKLLQVLSFLPAGESLSELKRVFPTEPFYPQNAVELLNLDLVKVETPLEFTKVNGSTVDLFRTGISGEEKRLIVPRQVRDYVNSIMSTEEFADISRATLFLMFGDNWLNGNAHLKPKRRRALQGVNMAGPGNEHAVVSSYLKLAIKENEPRKIRNAIRLSIDLVMAYRSATKYRDGATAAGELIAISSGLLTEEENKLLLIQYAKCLRMIGEREEALKILDSVLETADNKLTKSEQADVELTRSLIFEIMKNKERALESANRVLSLSDKGSGTHDQALGIIFSLEDDEKEKFSHLVEHEKASRSRKHFTVANNIAINLLSLLTDESAKCDVLQRVIDCQEDSYNRMRALVHKGKLSVVEDSKVYLSDMEKGMLRQAYTFLFTQRLGSLFDDCHKVLWRVCKDCKNLNDLLVVFRMSSFIWRLYGDKETEKIYVEDIDQELIREMDARSKPKVQMAIDYFQKRVSYYLTE